ncbi:hypothetical protein [Streptomyces prasinopilosus]|uniref:Uncharacterized protein n=1 Tax=Streptomyces prasinopilosus TaxID=67344 RepID=A0A1G6ML29_9ACTN|nr:hypothetical protein [Streptomyces prasinopilosus]SDC55696.1 hypothetical protein SAMN05216505_102576 [Streptomyces prasinopilosus]
MPAAVAAPTWYDATAFAGTLAARDASGVTRCTVELDRSPTTAGGATVTRTGTAVTRTGRTDDTVARP